MIEALIYLSIFKHIIENLMTIIYILSYGKYKN